MSYCSVRLADRITLGNREPSQCGVQTDTGQVPLLVLFPSITIIRTHLHLHAALIRRTSVLSLGASEQNGSLSENKSLSFISKVIRCNLLCFKTIITVKLEICTFLLRAWNSVTSAERNAVAYADIKYRTAGTEYKCSGTKSVLPKWRVQTVWQRNEDVSQLARLPLQIRSNPPAFMIVLGVMPPIALWNSREFNQAKPGVLSCLATRV